MIWGTWELLPRLPRSLPTLAEKRPPEEAIALRGLLLSGWPLPLTPLPGAGQAPRHRTRWGRRPVPIPKPTCLPGAARPSRLFFCSVLFCFLNILF